MFTNTRQLERARALARPASPRAARPVRAGLAKFLPLCVVLGECVPTYSREDRRGGAGCCTVWSRWNLVAPPAAHPPAAPRAAPDQTSGSMALLLFVAMNTVAATHLEARSSGGAPDKLAFHNAGTPPNISHSYDCESRRHAWRFAQATLPQRGEFRSAFDALQLQACGLSPPERWDEYVPPKLPTPTVGTVLFAAPSGTTSGDGSKQNPLSLRAAVAAATSAEKPVVLVLRKGVYHLTRSLQFGPAHSNLTIQNFQAKRWQSAARCQCTWRRNRLGS